MKHKLLALSAVALLFLSGCTSAASPQTTVTVTADAAPAKTTAPAPKEDTSTELSTGEKFDLYLTVGGVPSWMIEDRESRAILVDQAQTVCGYIDDGDSPDDILWIITLASSASDVDQYIIDAFLAASVAATYTYCPEHEGFWD